MTPTRTARPQPPEGCLWLREAAAHLGYAENTFRKWRVKRIGPPSFRVGGKVTYEIAELDRWFAEQRASDPHSNPALRESSAPAKPRVASAA